MSVLYLDIDSVLNDEEWFGSDDAADPAWPQSVRVVDGLTPDDVERAVRILGVAP